MFGGCVKYDIPSFFFQVLGSNRVKDEQGIPVIGASVKESGTSNGTVTDLDGNFSLSVAFPFQLQCELPDRVQLRICAQVAGRVTLCKYQ